MGDIFRSLFIAFLSYRGVYSLSQLTPEETDEPVVFLSKLKSSVFGYPSNEVGEFLQNNPDLKGNPEEYGNYFEGDILHPRPTARNGLLNETFRWPQGVVPVEIRGLFTPEEINTINRAFEIYHNLTCLKFVQRLIEQDYVIITNYFSGCFSSVGRIGGPQLLNLQAPCMKRIGTPLHELMHAIGFLHEHTREDRDDYIKLNWNNIRNETMRNFEKADNGTTIDYGVKYDYGSVMQYSRYAFAIDRNETTIDALEQLNGKIMGQRDGFAESDLEKIRAMYKCQGTTAEDEKQPSRRPFPLEVIDAITSIFGLREGD